MLRTPVVLSTTAFDELWRAERLGPHHTALNVASQWSTVDEQRRRRARVLAELADAGLADGGRPHPGLLAALHLIANADTECYGWITDRTGERGVVTAAAGADAILAVSADNRVALTPIRPTSAVDSLVAQLPPMHVSHSPATCVPAGAVSGDGEPVTGSATQDGFTVLAGPPVDQDAVRLARLLRAPRLGGGQLYVAFRDRFGTRVRCARPVSYFDNERGRWYTAVESNSGGDGWIVAIPATAGLLATKLRTVTALAH